MGVGEDRFRQRHRPAPADRLSTIDVIATNCGSLHSGCCDDLTPAAPPPPPPRTDGRTDESDAGRVRRRRINGASVFAAGRKPASTQQFSTDCFFPTRDWVRDETEMKREKRKKRIGGHVPPPPPPPPDLVLGARQTAANQDADAADASLTGSARSAPLPAAPHTHARLFSLREEPKTADLLTRLIGGRGR